MPNTHMRLCKLTCSYSLLANEKQITLLSAFYVEGRVQLAFSSASTAITQLILLRANQQGVLKTISDDGHRLELRVGLALRA